MSFRPVEFPAHGPDFNRPVAEAVYKSLITMEPDEAEVFGQMLLGATVGHELMVHGERIGKALDAVAEHRGQALQAQLARTAVAKSRGGQDPGGELVQLVELAKALGGDSSQERSARATKQLRDLQNGEFRVGSAVIDYTNDQAIPQHLAQAIGIPRYHNAKGEVVALTDEQTAQFQNAYHQVAALAGNYSMLPKGEAFLRLKRVDDSGKISHQLMDLTPELGTAHFDPRLPRITEAEVQRPPGKTAPGATFDVLRAFGLRPNAAALGAGQLQQGLLNQTAVGDFGTALRQTKATDDAVPSQRLFRRLVAGSTLLTSALGPAAPPQALMALNVANHVGTFGPVAQRVIGPTADRAAYRYRGTERKPSATLLRDFEETGTIAAAQTGATAATDAVAGVTQARDRALGASQGRYDDDFADTNRGWTRDKARFDRGDIDRSQYKALAGKYAAELDTAKRRRGEADKRARDTFKTAAAAAVKHADRAKQGHLEAANNIAVRGYEGDDKEWRPGPVLSYFHDRVPKQGLNRLHLGSGVVPPSEGVIIDAKGRLAHQAVGYGDDHYLPFNLKNLKALRGGEYIRTRTLGGPTTEDIYTGLIAGARRLTVVSNSGVFTVTFDDTFHGGRRYNDKAARMVGRYGHLLDAVKEGGITPADLDPSRLAELERAAAKIARPDVNQAGYAAALSDLRRRETENPLLSAQQRNEVAEDFLAEEAARRDDKGAELTTMALARDIATRNAKQVLAAQAEQQRQLRTGMVRAGMAPASLEVLPSLAVETQRQLQMLDQGPDGKPATSEEYANNIATQTGGSPRLAMRMRAAERANQDSLRTLRLNGPGYDAALRALTEQFPYYLREPEFHPWTNGSYGTDTGYVKPRHNRPAAALSGYFGTGINPSGEGSTGGKVTAESTRWQNGRQELIPRTTPALERTTAAAATAAPARANINPAEARTRADRAMLDHLLEQTKFGPDAWLIGPKDLADRVMRDKANVPGFPAALKPLYDKDPDAVQTEFQSGRLTHDQLADAVTWAQTHQAFPLSESVLAQFAAGGGTAAPLPLGDVGGLLARPTANWDLNNLGPEYNLASGSTAHSIGQAYLGDTLVSALATAGKLPPVPGEDGFVTKYQDLTRELGVRDKLLNQWKSFGGVADPPVNEADLSDAVHGLVRAARLNRNFLAAAAREKELADLEAAVAPPPPTTSNHLELVQAGTVEEHIKWNKEDPEGYKAWQETQLAQGMIPPPGIATAGTVIIEAPVEPLTFGEQQKARFDAEYRRKAAGGEHPGYDASYLNQ